MNEHSALALYFLFRQSSFVHDAQLTIDLSPVPKRLVHFLVASKVDRYRAFNNAVSLGKTLIGWLSLRYVAFGLSIALVVYMTFLTSAENLKIGEMASQFCFQLFMEFGYFSLHFSVTRSNASNAFSSVRADGVKFFL